VHIVLQRNALLLGEEGGGDDYVSKQQRVRTMLKQGGKRHRAIVCDSPGAIAPAGPVAQGRVALHGRCRDRSVGGGRQVEKQVAPMANAIVVLASELLPLKVVGLVWCHPKKKG